MRDLIQNQFDFEVVDLKKLNGYDNANYLVTASKGKFIFKTYLFSDEMLSLVEAENQTLLFLEEHQPDAFPIPVSMQDGTYVKQVEISGKRFIIRMLSFLEGSFLAEVEQTPELIQSIGVFLAQTDQRLLDFYHPVIAAREFEWDIKHLLLNQKYLHDITDVSKRNLVRYFFQQFKEQVLPALPNLRKSVIHNDANEWNILVGDGKVAGLIDFGDLAYTHLINELAIAMAYVSYDKNDPLAWAVMLLEAYHGELPLQRQEVELLYYLVAARLCISVCNSAHSRKMDPDNTYTSVSEKPAWDMLYRWLELGPVQVRKAFLEATGFSVEESPTIEDLVEKRHRSISPILSMSYAQPIHMERAAFQYMYDTHGNSFLDAYNNIPHVGHSHPVVVEAGQRQMARLNTNTRYVYDLLAEYAEQLLSKFPPALNKVFFVNSGSAASDLAIRLAHAHTGHRKMMVMEHGYHGNTQLGMDISHYKFNHQRGQGQKGYILMADLPNTYRGRYTNNDGSAGQQYAREAIRQIDESEAPIAAFISEPIVGCGGQVPLAKGYLKELYPVIRKQGGICISDEVQTGFGRLGEHFWGFEAQEVIPDVVVLGKPMGNGHPIGAVVTTEEVAQSFGQGVEFFSSFGGNPVSCAIGLAVLQVIEEEELQANAAQVGAYYKEQLNLLQNEFSCIGDVRGEGLFLGVELVRDGSMEPDKELAHLIKNQLRNQHILISTDGPWDSVLKTKPPLCFTRENAALVVDHIRRVLQSRT